MTELPDEVLPIKELTPSEYLAFSADESLHSIWSQQYRLVVSGSVNLAESPLRERIRHLPPAELKGSLQATGCKELESVSCHVQGDANLGETGLTCLGAGFGCTGNLIARNCHRLKEVRGIFPAMVDLGDSSVESLGADFSCGGNLHVDGCLSLTTLDCVVQGSVGADESTVSEFGENFFCLGNLDISNCPNIKRLGSIKGPPSDVYIGGSNLRQIDSQFRCTGDLMAAEVKQLVSLSGHVGKSVYVSRAPKFESVSELIAGASVSFENCPSLEHLELVTRGGLSLHNCGIEKIAQNTRVSGELSVTACPKFAELGRRIAWSVHLVDLPSLGLIRPDFKCEGNLTIMKCPKLLTLTGHVGKDAQLADLRSLKSLGTGFSVGGNLTLGGAKSLESLACRVEGGFKALLLPQLENTGVEFYVGGNAEFEECRRLKGIRGRVEGDAKIRASAALEKIGADFECQGNLILEGCSSLKILNCHVGANVSLERCGEVKLGPAFWRGGTWRKTGDTGPILKFPSSASERGRNSRRYENTFLTLHDRS